MLLTLSSLANILVSSDCFTFHDNSVAAAVHLVSIWLYRVTHDGVVDKLQSNLLKVKCNLGCRDQHSCRRRVFTVGKLLCQTLSVPNMRHTLVACRHPMQAAHLGPFRWNNRVS